MVYRVFFVLHVRNRCIRPLMKCALEPSSQGWSADHDNTRFYGARQFYAATRFKWLLKLLNFLQGRSQDTGGICHRALCDRKQD